MGKVSYKSAEDLNKEVWSYPTGDGVRLVARGYNGIGVAILLANRDACDLGKHLIEFAENNLSIDEQPQPRRPDEVGVWECWYKSDPDQKFQVTVFERDGVLKCRWRESSGLHVTTDAHAGIVGVGVRIGDLPSEEPAWPLNGEWGDRGQPPTCEGVFDADSIWDGGTLTVVRHGDQLYAGTAGVSGPLWGIDDPQFKATKWRYLRPLEEPQEAKPQLIDVAETLMLAVRHLRHEVEWLIERTGADTDRVGHVERIVDQAHDALAKLREVQ